MSSLDSMRTILDGLVDRLPAGLSGADLGEVLDRLIWLTDDNGADLLEVCREWLAGDDERRAAAALSVTEAFLYKDREGLERNLRPVAAKWPRLAPRVQEILDVWDGGQQAEA